MNFKLRVYYLIGAMFSVVLTSCNSDVVSKDLDLELQALISQHDLPSLSACIFKEGKIIWLKTYGLADKERAIEVDEGTIYHLGSISKLFVVTAVMQLEEQGVLDLDEDISSYLPENFRHPQFPDIPISTRMLLTHTAGLSWPQSYDAFNGMWDQFDPDQGPTPSQWVPEYLIPSGANYDAALWKLIEPGTYEFYSNIGTCVAAYVVEQISSLHFRDYCKTHIFDPLGMSNTSYNYSDLKWDKIATMYDKQNRGSHYFDIRVYAASGAKSTLQDLSVFATCYLAKGLFLNHRMLSETSIDKILEIQNPASGKCLIWDAYLDDWYGHTGGLILGTATTLAIHPKSKTGFLIFTNSHSGVVHPGGSIYNLVREKAYEFMD